MFLRERAGSGEIMVRVEQKLKKILLIACDPGGANAIAGVYDILVKKGYELSLYGKETAIKRYEFLGFKGKLIDFDDLDSEESIRWFIQKQNPGLIITGTSANDYLEKKTWNIGRKMGIPVWAVLDQWMNYGIRFSRHHLKTLDKYLQEKDISYRPDKIFVMDGDIKREMIDLGFDEKSLIDSGSPYFELLANQKTKFKANNENQIRLVYASEPITQDYKSSDYWGYTEVLNFKCLLANLEKYAAEKHVKIHLLVKLHPRESGDFYKTYRLNEDNNLISIEVIEGLTTFNWAEFDLDCVVGMSSMFLIEAALIGIPIISLQLNLKKENPFILTRKKVIKTIISGDELYEELESVLQNKLGQNNSVIDYFKLNSSEVISREVEKIVWNS